jgi:hypothetical protein
MNVVLPFIASETNQAVRWLRWVLEYCGFQERHRLWLLPFKGIDTAEMKKTALLSFKEVDLITDALGVVSDWQTGAQWRDSRGPNSMFRQAAWHFYYAKVGPWFFCEPDCIPTKKDAFDSGDNEYRICGKPFMGTIIQNREDPDKPWLNGVAIYPADAVNEAPTLLQMAEFPNGMEIAFDRIGAPEVLPKAHDSKLFQNVYYALPDEAPTFPRDAHLLKPETAFFHRNKDGTLINWLRGKPGADGHGMQGEPAARGRASVNVEPRYETPVQPSRHEDVAKILDDFNREENADALSKQRARMAHARAVMAEKRARGEITPRKRRRRRRRKA